MNGPTTERSETIDHLPVYVCAKCRTPDHEHRPLVNLTQAARKRYGLEHQRVHPECRLKIHAERRQTNRPA